MHEKGPILRALIENPRRSDRELAKICDVSQPTITRTRSSFERRRLMHYTAVPNFEKLGYTVLAFHTVVLNARARAQIPEFIKEPCVIFAADFDNNLLAITRHLDYLELAHWAPKYHTEFQPILAERILKNFRFEIPEIREI